MSNTLTNNPFILDTAADNLVAPGKRLKLKAVKWSGDDIADGDTLQIEDGNEVIKFVHIATADDTGGYWEMPGSGLVMDGLSLGTITHGIAYLYF